MFEELKAKIAKLLERKNQTGTLSHDSPAVLEALRNITEANKDRKWNQGTDFDEELWKDLNKE